MDFNFSLKKIQTIGPGVYKTDLFHKSPIFIVEDKNKKEKKYFRSWEEAFTFHGSAGIQDINPEYIASLINYSPNAQVSPYKRILRVPRSSSVLIKEDGSSEFCSYDPFSEFRSIDNATDLYKFVEERFSSIIKKNIKDGSSQIAFELSSGIDSNAILGCATKELKINRDRINTCSYEGAGELNFLNESFQQYKILEDKRHIFYQNDLYNQKKYNLDRNLEVLGAPAQISNFPIEHITLRKIKCKLLFSGLGGDQAVSHNGSNIPYDLVVNQRYFDLFKWSGSLKNSFRYILENSFFPEAIQKLKFIQQERKFLKTTLLEDYFTEDGFNNFKTFFRKKDFSQLNTKILMRDSIFSRVSSEMLAVRVDEEIRYANFYGMKKCFPFLDELIIGTLIRQDPLFFSDGIGLGRKIARKSFSRFLSSRLLKNGTKKRDIQKKWEDDRYLLVKNDLLRILSTNESWHSLIHKYWKINRLVDFMLERIEKEKKLHQLLGIEIALDTLTALDHWFKNLE